MIFKKAHKFNFLLLSAKAFFMPLIHSENLKPNTALYVWEASESLSLLQNILLSQQSKIKLNRIRPLQDKKNFLAVRHILLHKGFEDTSLRHEKNGKPYLLGDTHISISHSFDKVAVVFSAVSVGVDIEKQRTQLLKVKHKFIGKEHAYLRPENVSKQLLVIWCIKESLYKLHGIKGLSLKKHIEVLPFDSKDTLVAAIILHPSLMQKYWATIGFIENFCWAVCTI